MSAFGNVVSEKQISVTKNTYASKIQLQPDKNNSQHTHRHHRPLHQGFLRPTVHLLTMYVFNAQSGLSKAGGGWGAGGLERRGRTQGARSSGRIERREAEKIKGRGK